MKRAAVALALLAACSHEVARTREIRSARIELLSTTVVYADQVRTEHPCRREVGYVLSLGLLWLLDWSVENIVGNKFDDHECPRIETTYENESRIEFPITSSAPRRDFGAGVPSCVFATPADGCVIDKDRHQRVPAWFAHDIRSIDSIAPDGSRLVAATGDGHCAIVTADGERPITCSTASFLDNSTIFFGDGRIVDADSGIVLGRTDKPPFWLGGRLAARWRGAGNLEVMRVDGWVPLLRVDVIATFVAGDVVELVGRRSLIELQSNGVTIERPVNIPIKDVLDVRGDLMLVKTPAGTAMIRVSTGEVIARS